MDLGQAGYVVTSCATEGGIFAGAVLWISLFILGALTLWAVVLALQSQTRRDYLKRIRDLLIGGSLGEAILLADRRSKDPVFGVVRSTIATLQATKSRDEARDRIESELAEYFPQRRNFGRALLAGLVAMLMLLPLGVGLGGQQWARGEITKAAQSMAEILPEGTTRTDGIARVWEDGRGSLMYTCPTQLGWPATLLLIAPALLVGFFYRRHIGAAAVRHTRDQCQRFVEMGARILDPHFRVYQREQGVVEVRERDHLPTGGRLTD